MRASYRHAIQWLADNDDTEWLDSEYGSPSVATCLVADLWGKHTDEVTRALRAYIARTKKGNS